MPRHMPTNRTGVVSGVLVNYRGADDTIDCLASLGALDWPAENLELIVVDNASGDGSAERVRAAAPAVKVIESGSNLGFAGGCNLAVEHATGEFIALINNDARPHPAWLTAAVHELVADRTIGAVASKVLDWDGELVDFVGGHVNFAGQGYKLEAGEPDDEAYDVPRDVLYPTGSAAVIRASVFREVGGLDERYFMFYEDVDLGWRMNLAGHRVRYVPRSVVYHKHHASIGKLGAYREDFLLARNSLLTIYKNFGDDLLRTVLAPALLLDVMGAVRLGGDDPRALDLAVTSDGDDDATITVDKRSLAGAYAVDYLAANIAELTAARQEVQRTRVRTDHQLAPLFGDLLQATHPAPGYHGAWLDMVHAFGLDDRLLSRRILVITGDTLSPRMAGPAIRAFHIADELAGEHEVKLVSIGACSITSERFECAAARGAKLEALGRWADIIIFQGFVLHHEPWIGDLDVIVVVDMYDPVHLEQLEQSKSNIDEQRRRQDITSTTKAINDQLERADFILCASEEQRHFWLGQLSGLGRLNAANYDRDSSLRSLLDLAPFGMPNEPPARTRTAIKGVVPGIAPTDKVVLWGGGVYNWFDPLSLIQAIAFLAKEHDDIRLFFLGMKHPNPDVPEMAVAWKTRQLSDELGLTGRNVFFNEAWVDYDDRANYLLDADVGVSTHYLHVETTFSFRTRILDYLWAGLPIVATEGDAFGRLVEAEALGVAVPEMDVEALADALERTLYDEAFRADCRANIARIRRTLTWSDTLAPLVEFCRYGGRAADAEDVDRKRALLDGHYKVPEGFVARNAFFAWVRFREGGVQEVVRRGSAKLSRIAAQVLRR